MRLRKLRRQFQGTVTEAGNEAAPDVQIVSELRPTPATRDKAVAQIDRQLQSLRNRPRVAPRHRKRIAELEIQRRKLVEGLEPT